MMEGRLGAAEGLPAPLGQEMLLGRRMLCQEELEAAGSAAAGGGAVCACVLVLATLMALAVLLSGFMVAAWELGERAVYVRLTVQEGGWTDEDLQVEWAVAGGRGGGG